MSQAGWLAAGDQLRIPQAADVTVAMTVTEAIDGAAAVAVDLTGSVVKFTVARKLGERVAPVLELASDDPTPRVTVTDAVNGELEVVFVPADFATALTGVYRLDVVATGETAGKPYGSARFEVDAT